METSSNESLGPALIDGTRVAFQAQKQYADKAIVQLPDERLHMSLDEHTNSIAVIMKHVGGNLKSRWTDFLTTDGEKSWRNRDDEFVDTFRSREEVLAAWEGGWQALFQTLHDLQPDDLTRRITIRGEPHSVPLAIQRSLAHTSYHCGQIVLVARVLAVGPWNTITIPRGQSASFNTRVWGQGHYQTPPPGG